MISCWCSVSDASSALSDARVPDSLSRNLPVLVCIASTSEFTPCWLPGELISTMPASNTLVGTKGGGGGGANRDLAGAGLAARLWDCTVALAGAVGAAVTVMVVAAGGASEVSPAGAVGAAPVTMCVAMLDSDAILWRSELLQSARSCLDTRHDLLT